MLRVFVVDKDWDIARMFQRHGGFEIVSGRVDADIVCFGGGADVDPKLYNDVKHPTTGCNEAADARDLLHFNATNGSGVLMVGICRGGQFLNVMNGGALYQDCDKHAIAGMHTMTYTRKMKTLEDIKTALVTSTHHQMMIPNDKTEYQKWGWTERSTYRDRGADRRRPKDEAEGSDTEILWYPKTNCLCFQPHPEWDDVPTQDVFFYCLDRALDDVRSRRQIVRMPA